MRQAVWLTLIQWGCVCGFWVLVRTLFGGISVLPVPAGLFLGALVYFLRVVPAPLTRQTVRNTSRKSGLLSIGIVTALYWIAFACYPNQFDFSALNALWLGPLIGAGGGLVAFVFCLIAGDSAASTRDRPLS